MRPEYTEELMRRHAGLDGRVELEVVVGEDGLVRAIRVARGLSADVDEVVVEAARRQLNYLPASLRGKPIPARTTVIVGVRFRIDGPRP